MLIIYKDSYRRSLSWFQLTDGQNYVIELSVQANITLSEQTRYQAKYSQEDAACDDFLWTSK
jgi:hypothetical protein